MYLIYTCLQEYMASRPRSLLSLESHSRLSRLPCWKCYLCQPSFLVQSRTGIPPVILRCWATRQSMYVQRNTDAHSCKHCCRSKEITITYSQFTFIALVIQHAMRMRHTVIYGLSGCNTFFFTFSHKRHDFRRKIIIEHKMCVFVFST